MTEIHIHGPAVVRIESDGKTPTVEAHKQRPQWRTWPNECPTDGEDLVLRFTVHGAPYVMIGYADAGEFYDPVSRLIFFDDDVYADDFKPDTVFDSRTPDEVQFIPLSELIGKEAS